MDGCSDGSQNWVREPVNLSVHPLPRNRMAWPCELDGCSRDARIKQIVSCHDQLTRPRLSFFHLVNELKRVPCIK